LHEFGELETVLTTSGILKSWQESSTNSGSKTRIAPTIAEFLELAQSGDSRATKIIQQRADIVSDVLVNLALVLNPSLILLGGTIGSHPTLIALVQKQLESSEFAVPNIAASSLGDRAVLWGGIATALGELANILLPSPEA
jgi:glucokinase